jgi:hypothetical protein
MKIPINKILQGLGIDDLELKSEKEVEEFKKQIQFILDEDEIDNEETAEWKNDFLNALKEGIKDKE